LPFKAGHLKAGYPDHDTPDQETIRKQIVPQGLKPAIIVIVGGAARSRALSKLSNPFKNGLSR
jgi:hypothetical protein